MQRPVLVWYWFNLIRDHTHTHTHTGESVDVKQEVRIINEGGSIIISHYIIHGGYCKDINHCCRKWLNNCHKSQLNTIRHPNSPFPINMCRNNEGFFLLFSSRGVGYALMRYDLDMSTNTHTCQENIHSFHRSQKLLFQIFQRLVFH